MRKNSKELYEKLRNYLAVVQTDKQLTPHQRKELFEEWKCGGTLSDLAGRLHSLITWMPFLKIGYRRLTYEEFCQAYNLEMINV